MANLLQPYQVKQSNNLLALNWTLGEPIIKTLWFTKNAIWSSSENDQTAQKILNLGKNPGLGVRALHANGITGQGVTVAIIDQYLITDHPEFKGKIIEYRDFGTDHSSDEGSMHGPAVTSLLAGENIGTAPGVKVYFAAVPAWLLDAQYYADALDWIIAENEKLPENQKIRVVSVSSIPSGLWSEYKNQDAWDAAYERALKAGILVLDCTYEHGYTNPCTLDMYDPDNVAKCVPQWNGPTGSPHKRIYVPMLGPLLSGINAVNQKIVLAYHCPGAIDITEKRGPIVQVGSDPNSFGQTVEGICTFSDGSTKVVSNDEYAVTTIVGSLILGAILGVGIAVIFTPIFILRKRKATKVT